MINIKIDEYVLSLYVLLWSFYFLYRGFQYKAPVYFKAWVLAQVIISLTLTIVLFVNKGYCVFNNCEPTNTIIKFIKLDFDPSTIIALRILNLTLIFFIINKMHNYIEKHRNQEIKT